MTAKKLWFTWLPGEKGAEKPDKIFKSLSGYGFDVRGNNWVDDLPAAAWQAVALALLDKKQADMWIIAGTQENFASPSNRYGLSLLTAVVQEGRGAQLPIVCLGLNYAPLADSMPTLLQPKIYLSTKDAGWQAKLVARVAGAKKQPLPEYRLCLHAYPQLGQWFELGARDAIWNGVMFGVSEGAAITHQGVGPRGQVPEKAVLEYQCKDIKATVGETPFTVWSAQNKLGPDDSYYARVDGFPAKIILGGHPGDDQAEVYIITLK